MSNYPEHEKLDAVGMEKLTIEEFLTWLGDEGIYFGKPDGFESLAPLAETNENLVARFFQVDPKKLEQVGEGEVVSAHVVPAGCSEIVYSDPYGNLRLKKLDVDQKTLLLFSTHPLEVELMSQVQEKFKVDAWDAIRIVAPYVTSLHESQDVSNILSQIIADHKESEKSLSTKRLEVIEGLTLLSANDFDKPKIERMKKDIADLVAEVRRLCVVKSQRDIAVFELLKQADALCHMGEGKYDSGATTHQAEILYALERIGLFKITGSSSYRYIWGELTEAGKEAMLEALEVRYDF